MSKIMDTNRTDEDTVTTNGVSRLADDTGGTLRMTDNDGRQQQEQPLSPRSRRRMAALEQANSVVELVGGYNHLDVFNLLGVVANPRAGGASNYSPASPSSVHGRYNPPGSHNDSSVDTQQQAGSSVLSTFSFQSFEQTMSQVSESIGVFNNVLEDWSRSILEDNPSGSSSLVGSSATGIGNATSNIMNPLYAMMGGSTAQDEADAIPESQLKELPEELENPNVSAVHSYIQHCGAEAASFQQILGESYNRSSGSTGSSNRSRTFSSDYHDRSPNGKTRGRQRLSSTESVQSYNGSIDVSDIPGIFFDEGFDLTNSTTFCDLLLLDKGTNILSNNQNDKTDNKRRSKRDDSDEDVPVSDLFPVLHPESLNGYFDKVELALLEQVRANSGQFFAESQRFAGLHEEIHSLLATVQDQRSINIILQKDMIATAEIIPTCDEQREQLRQLWDVLDRADALLQCKEGIAGILSAQGDLTAIEQIQHGRRLLQPQKYPAVSKNEANGTRNCEKQLTCNPEIELGLLRALKPISEQLDQYEELVVNNLRDELVEIFLAWNNHTITYQSSSSSAYGSSSNSSNAMIATGNAPILKENIRNRINEINGALHSCHALAKAKEAYQNRLQDVIRMTVRTTVGEFASDSGSASSTISSAATAMSLTRFLDCLDMLFDQMLSLLTSAVSVDAFYVAEGLTFEDSPSEKENTNATLSTDEQNSINEDGTTALIESPTKFGTPLTSTIVAAAELSSKSISELLRLRKEAHSLVSLEEMKSIWDACTDFSRQIENLCTKGTTGGSNISSDLPTSNFAHTSLLRSTLLTQAKAFLERKHESYMSALVAALDSERWVQCDVSFERQSALSRLCSGRAILVPSTLNSIANGEASSELNTVTQEKRPEIEAEGVRYKVVWSCLLLVEMILTNIATSAQFSTLSTNCVSKVSELLRLFNSRTTHLVLGAGAIHSNARLKSINAKHLSLVTQCLGLVIAILPHVRAALSAQMPKKQHTLLTGLDQIKKEYADHNEKILNKFVSIIGGIVEHGLAKQIYGTDFDSRAKVAQTTAETPSSSTLTCCVFLDGVSSNTRKMHQVLSTLLPPDHLKDVFSRIYAYIDSKVPALFIAAAEASENQQSSMKIRNENSGKSPQRPNQSQPMFWFPKTTEGKRQFLLEVESTTRTLNSLDGIHPWDFTARNVLERRVEYSVDDNLDTSSREAGSKEELSSDAEQIATTTEEPEAIAREDDSKTDPQHILRINSQDDEDEMTEFQSAAPQEEIPSPGEGESTTATLETIQDYPSVVPSGESAIPEESSPETGASNGNVTSQETNQSSDMGGISNEGTTGNGESCDRENQPDDGPIQGEPGMEKQMIIPVDS